MLDVRASSPEALRLLAPIAPARASFRIFGLLVAAISFCLLIAPALWNGYPLLQYDTGGYLARWYEGYLVPSRSTVFGIYLHAGEGLHFWPMVAIQAAIIVWVVFLALRQYGLGPRRALAIMLALSLLTTLPWLTSILLTDIFAGASVLGLHLLLFRPSTLGRWEQRGLLALIAFAAATHSATLAILLAIVAMAAATGLLCDGLVALRQLILGIAAIVLGAMTLIGTNYALSGQLAWTPGGYGIAFGRMLQDGIVRRYLNDHCPDGRLRLCPYRNELPATADEFLWSYGIFNDLGRFAGLGDEMRTIVLASVVEYPGEQIRTALRATAQQLTLAASGAGVHDRLPHTYGIIEHFIPGEVPAMRASRQQRGELRFDGLNRLHVPVALGSMLVLPLLLLRLRRSRFDEIAWLAASAITAIVANAFVLGAISGPHDRYGARIAWFATFVLLLAGSRIVARSLPFGRTARESGRPCANPHNPLDV